MSIDCIIDMYIEYKLLIVMNMNKAIIKAKKIECVIGLFLLIPPVLGVVAFVLQIFEADTDFSMMRDLSSSWTALCDQGGGMSAAPIYLGLMALAGVYLIKDALYSLFTALDDDSDIKKK